MAEKRIAVIGIPGKWSTEVLADAVEQRTGYRRVIDIAEVQADLTGRALYHGEQNLCELDGILVKKINAEYSPHTIDRIELLRIAEAQGVRVFSPATSMLRLINRLACTVTLRSNDIPMPPTLVCESTDAVLAAVEEFGSAILKPLFSTKARGMCVIKAGQATARQEIEAFRQENPIVYVQQKLALPGRDLGLVFLGGTYLGAYARVKQGDAWNTTIHDGGKYAGCDASQDIIDLAYRAQAYFDMDFTTVDIAESENGPLVFEVSAFGGFAGAKEGIGIDAASLYADYALNELSQS